MWKKCSTPLTFLKLLYNAIIYRWTENKKDIQVKYLIPLGIFDFNFRQDKLSVQVWALLKKKVAGFARGQNYVYQVLKKLKWIMHFLSLTSVNGQAESGLAKMETIFLW